MMARYAEYKESGVDWLGEIPGGGEILNNKYIFQEKTESVGEKAKKFKLLSLTLGGVIPRDMENPKGKFPAEFNTYKQVSANDLVFCLFDVEETPRAVGIAGEAGMITGAYTVLKSNSDANPSFLNYYYLSLDNGKQLKSLYTGLRNVIKIDTFMSIKTPFPDIETQTAIAKFLDDKVARIEALVGIKRRQIELLAERKQILIQNAVTQGLNPDAPMKDSGVDWIGEIPAHWETKKLTWITSAIGDGLHGTPDYVDNSDYWFINGNNLRDGEIGFFDSTRNVSKNQYLKHYIPLNNSTLFLSINGTIGNGALYNNEKIMLGKSTACINCREALNREYALYLITSTKYQEHYKIEVTGTTIYNLSLQSIRTLPILLPSLVEQNQIILQCRNIKSQTDCAVNSIKNQITKLTEYKTTLINAAVTGKIKVAGE